jgi:hypothetical protein
MRVDKQLAIFLENKPGTLAKVCAALAEKNISLLALTVSDTVDHAVVRIVVDRPDEAIHVLGSNAVLVVESDVLVVEVPNRPGALAEIAGQLAENNVNIEYAYCTAAPDQPKGMLVLRTHDPKRAMKALSRK